MQKSRKIIYLHSILLILRMLKSDCEPYKNKNYLAEKVSKNVIFCHLDYIMQNSHQIPIR
jgi:hypothetical protein